MFKPARAYGDAFNSYDALKLIALLTMVVDHCGVYIWPEAQALRAIGRMAFPLFLFLVGYSGSWRMRKDLLVLAVIVTFTAALTWHPVLPLNVLFAIAVTRLLMDWLTRQKPYPHFGLVTFLMCIIWYMPFIWIDYSTLAVLFAICGYLVRTEPHSQRCRWFIVMTVLVHFLLQYMIFKFDLSAVMLMAAMAAAVLWIMLRFELCSWSLQTGNGLRSALQWAARNTLPLYAAHLCALMIIERLVFPERLTHFRWI